MCDTEKVKFQKSVEIQEKSHLLDPHWYEQSEWLKLRFFLIQLSQPWFYYGLLWVDWYCNICTKTKIMSKCLSRFILLFLKSLQKSTYLHYSSFMNQRKAYHTYKVFTFLFILGKMSFKTVSVLKNTFIISCHGKKMRNLDIFTICYLTWGYWPVSTRPKL